MVHPAVFSHNLNTLKQLQAGTALTVDAKGYLIPTTPSPEKSFFARFFSRSSDQLNETINHTCQEVFDRIIRIHSPPLTSNLPELTKERVKVKRLLDGVEKLGENILSSRLKADLKELVESPETLEARLALRQGIAPKALNQTISGTYVMHNRLGKPWGIFKPMRQEAGGDKNPNWLVWATVSAENWDIESCTGYLRECAAYQLDREHFSEVPLTVSTNFKHSVLDTSILSFSVPDFVGSFQLFKEKCDPLATSLKSYEYLSGKRNSWLPEIIDKIYVLAIRCLFYLGLSHISEEQIHKMAILDIRILNCDRHLNNCLIEKNNKTLYPIDHGLILPNKATHLRFDWKDIVQSRFPFSKRSLNYIERLDPYEDARILKNFGIASNAIERMKLSTMLLKAAAARGLTPYQIADLMQQNVLFLNNAYFEEIICRRVLTKGESPQIVIKKAIDDYVSKI